jgi:hypothetical protein
MKSTFTIFDANTVAYLIAKGCRVLAIDHRGYHFQETDRHLVQDYHNGGVVIAKDFADAASDVFRAIKTIRAKNRMVREILKPDASLAVLCGKASETSRTASV